MTKMATTSSPHLSGFSVFSKVPRLWRLLAVVYM